MRVARIKVEPECEEAVYHCMTRTVNGEKLFDDVSREVLRKMLWQTADYCGVEILTYAILSNHFHVLVRVPIKRMPSDAELLRRFRVMYPIPTPHKQERLEVIRRLLEANGAEADAWRQKQYKLMGDISHFMRFVKLRFSIWFNATHSRFGTLWSERFKSVLVEPQDHATQVVGMYIDLNCVRAKIAEDPKDYRFCGYGEAVAGSSAAQNGIRTILGTRAGWNDAHANYREAMFGTGVEAKEEKGVISPAAFEKVLMEGGRLPLPSILRSRIRYFTDGAVLGSRAFVETHLAQYQKRYRMRQRCSPSPLADVTDWCGLTTLRGLRTNPFC